MEARIIQEEEVAKICGKVYEIFIKKLMESKVYKGSKEHRLMEFATGCSWVDTGLEDLELERIYEALDNYFSKKTSCSLYLYPVAKCNYCDVKTKRHIFKEKGSFQWKAYKSKK